MDRKYPIMERKTPPPEKKKNTLPWEEKPRQENTSICGGKHLILRRKNLTMRRKTRHNGYKNTAICGEKTPHHVERKIKQLIKGIQWFKEIVLRTV